MTARVLLVNPNRMKPAVAPIGLDYVADGLQAAGHDVSLLDLCCAEPPQEVGEAVRAADPHVVGVTLRNTDDCYFASRTSFLPDLQALIARLRASTDAPIVLGGAGFSVMPEPILRSLESATRNPALALFGIAGDGEDVFPELVTRLVRRQSFDHLPGLVWRTDDRVVQNGRAVADLSAAVRSRRFLNNARYFAEGGQGGLETKRGCASACIYCADPVAKGHHARLRPPSLVADEGEALLSQGVDHLHLCDPEFNLPYEHAVAVCEELIARRLGERLRWYTYAAPAPFSQELAALMRRAGCAGINFGADSAVDEQLRRLGRSYAASDVAAAVRRCREAELAVMVDLLIGGPGETPATVAATVEAMRSLDPDAVGASVGVRIYPGTPLARLVAQEGFSPANASLRGPVEGNAEMLEPVYYVAAALGPDPLGLVNGLVRGDPRFFTGERDAGDSSYNYNDNAVLVEAIRRGHRGAYWHILRQLNTDHLEPETHVRAR